MQAESLLIETKPARQDVDYIDNQLKAYNITQTGVAFGGELACFVHNDQGDIVAGLYGYTWGDFRTRYAQLPGAGFYQKQDYEIISAVDSYPRPQHQVIYLKKRLGDMKISPLLE